MTGDNKTVLCFMCHPDDTEFMTAGTLALLRDAGWNIVIATMTAGDCGSNELGRTQISEVRKAGASKLVRTACFTCGMPNVQTPGVEKFDFVPYLYYADPLGGSEKVIAAVRDLDLRSKASGTKSPSIDK